MRNYNLDALLKEQGLILTVFDGRYGDGIIAFLSYSAGHAEPIYDEFTGGDYEWAAVRNGLQTLSWFPIVFTESVSEVPGALQTLLDTIAQKSVDVPKWITCVELAARLIVNNKHRQTMYGLVSNDPLCDLTQAEELLWKLNE